MKTVCKDCQGTGRLGFQQESCWCCGGSGYIDDLVYKAPTVYESVITPIKDASNITYEGNLEKYFKEVKECNIQSDTTRILSDIYDLIKNGI